MGSVANLLLSYGWLKAFSLWVCSCNTWQLSIAPLRGLRRWGMIGYCIFKQVSERPVVESQSLQLDLSALSAKFEIESKTPAWLRPNPVGLQRSHTMISRVFLSSQARRHPSDMNAICGPRTRTTTSRCPCSFVLYRRCMILQWKILCPFSRLRVCRSHFSWPSNTWKTNIC